MTGRSMPGGRRGRRAVALVADAVRTLAARPLRALGMVAGVVFGVAAGGFTIVFTASEQAQVVASFDRQLSAVVVIESGGAASSPPVLSPLAVQQERQIASGPGVVSGGELSTWRREAEVRSSRVGEVEIAPIFGVSPGGIEATGVEVVGGAPLGLLQDLGQNVAWVGQQLASELGIDPTSPAGQTMIIDGVEFTVGGVTSRSPRYPSLGRSIVMASQVAEAHWPGAEEPRVFAHVQRGAAPVAAGHLVLALDPGGAAGLRDMTPPDGGELRDSVTSDVRRAGLALSGLALAIGTISVANVLSIAVLERTRELGLRSALGWSVMRLARLVMVEAVVAGAMATIVGMAIGLVGSRIACDVNGWEPVLPTTALWLPAAGGVCAALLGGVMPAIRAGLVDPVDALRN